MSDDTWQAVSSKACTALVVSSLLIPLYMQHHSMKRGGKVMPRKWFALQIHAYFCPYEHDLGAFFTFIWLLIWKRGRKQKRDGLTCNKGPNMKLNQACVVIQDMHIQPIGHQDILVICFEVYGELYRAYSHIYTHPMLFVKRQKTKSLLFCFVEKMRKWFGFLVLGRQTFSIFDTAQLLGL